MIESYKTITLEIAQSRFITSLSQRRLSKRTTDTYRQRLRSLVDMYGHKVLNDISADDIDEWLNRFVNRKTRYYKHPYRPKKEGKLAARTLSGLVQACKAFLAWCQSRYGMSEWYSPAAHLKRPTIENGQDRAMRLADLKNMLDEARARYESKQLRDLAILAFMADTAVRVGEAASLNCNQLDLTNNIATVVGKTGTREVIFADETATILQAWLEHSENETAVFTALHGTNKGGRLTTGGIYLVFKRLAKKSEVTGRFNPHSLRHLIGQWWADNGVNIELIRMKLGHSSVKTTLEFYMNQDTSRVAAVTTRLSLIYKDD